MHVARGFVIASLHVKDACLDRMIRRVFDRVFDRESDDCLARTPIEYFVKCSIGCSVNCSNKCVMSVWIGPRLLSTHAGRVANAKHAPVRYVTTCHRNAHSLFASGPMQSETSDCTPMQRMSAVHQEENRSSQSNCDDSSKAMRPKRGAYNEGRRITRRRGAASCSTGAEEECTQRETKDNEKERCCTRKKRGVHQRRWKYKGCRVGSMVGGRRAVLHPEEKQRRSGREGNTKEAEWSRCVERDERCFTLKKSRVHQRRWKHKRSGVGSMGGGSGDGGAASRSKLRLSRLLECVPAY